MMDKFVKTLKTTKRRISQQLKVATGQAEMTRDAEFDLAYRDFADLESNLKLLSSQCVSIIHNVDSWCDTNRKLADELLHFTMKSEVDTEDMTEYREAVNNLHIALQAEYDYTRRAIICVLRSHIIVRIDGLLKQEFAAVEKAMRREGVCLVLRLLQLLVRALETVQRRTTCRRWKWRRWARARRRD